MIDIIKIHKDALQDLEKSMGFKHQDAPIIISESMRILHTESEFESAKKKAINQFNEAIKNLSDK